MIYIIIRSPTLLEKSFICSIAMTQTPKRQKIKKQLILSASNRGSAANWRDPNDESRELSRDLEAWIKFAKLAEKGKLHSIFVIDHLTWFDVYGGSHEAAAKAGVNAARISPAEIASAIAVATESIGFGITLSTVSEHPYHFARRLASLDHLTKGRIGWNIVGSYLPSIGPNLLNGEPLPEHDERYNRSQEYLDVVYSLLLSSWRDDAIVYNKKNSIFADPERVREINHKGKYFDVLGPAITEPSVQRFPLVIQAGSSDRGRLFAAENAELIYIGLKSDNYGKTRKQIADIRKKAKQFGRDPYSIKLIAPLNVFVGRTHEEAVIKQEKFKALLPEEDSLIYFGGTSGVDISVLGWDDPIPINGESNGIAGSIDNIKNEDGTTLTKRQLVEKNLNQRTKFVGTPSEIADLIEEVVTETDVDGFNFSTNSFPSGLEDLVELLIPELQKRGLAQTEYSSPGGTFRENLYGIKGENFLAEDHPAHNLRWKKNVSKKDFEKKLEEYTKIRADRRQGAGIKI